MSENTTTVTLHLYGDGKLDCWVQEPGGPVISFDPLQLPDKMKAVMGQVPTAALAKMTEATTRAEQAETAKADVEAKFAAVEGAKVEHLQTEMDAKDANIQALMAELESLKK